MTFNNPTGHKADLFLYERLQNHSHSIGSYMEDRLGVASPLMPTFRLHFAGGRWHRFQD